MQAPGYSVIGTCEDGRPYLSSKDINLNIVALPNTTSYGKVATNVLRELRFFKQAALFLTTENPRGLEIHQDDHLTISLAMENRKIFNPDAPSLKIWHHEWGHDMFPAGMGKKYHWTIFELDQFSYPGRHSLRAVDGIIVCSEWAKKVVQDNEIDVPTYVIPLGHNVPSYLRKKNRSDSVTKFIHCGKWEVRKSQIEIPECFERAFSETDKVELHLVCSNRLLQDDQQRAWKETFKNTRLASKIHVYEWLNDDNEVYSLMSSCDCGIYLNKAEGFNLPLLESLAVGLPVIVLNYSGPTEFLTKDNAYLIEPTSFSVAWDGYWFSERSNPNDGLWADVTETEKEQCILHMRDVYDRKNHGEDLVNYKGIKTAGKYTWENSVSKLLGVI